MRQLGTAGVFTFFTLLFMTPTSFGQVVSERVITVTTAADDVNGNTSSVAGLEAAPGPDGISLREAIQATNNDPGKYSVRFASSLKGSSITMTSAYGDMTPMTGGGVQIDGDVDGDGVADVTLVSQHKDTCLCGWGINVASSGNTLRALALRGFDHGVVFTPAGRGQDAPLPLRTTFSGNVVSGLVLTGIGKSGIVIDTLGGGTGCEAQGGCRTDNRWTDFRIQRNTIQAGVKGIELKLSHSSGEIIERLTIDANRITMSAGADAAIALDIGGGLGGDANRVSNAIVADNAIEVVGHTGGINAFSGFSGGSGNVIDGLKIFRNRVHYSAPQRARAVHLAMSDGCAGQICSDGNVAKNIEVIGNVLEGQDEAGIAMSSPCCGPGYHGLLSGVRIADNVIKGVIPVTHANPWGVIISTGATDVADVVIERNTIEQRTIDPDARHAAYLAAGGIAILGGLGKGSSSVTNVSVTNNRIDTPVAGILILGGGADPFGEGFRNEITENVVSQVTLRGNVISRGPSLLTHWDSELRGISVIGGLGPAPGAQPQVVRNNRVTGVVLEGNDVVGVSDDVYVRANFGSGVTGNLVSAVTGAAKPTPSPSPAPTAPPSPQITTPSVGSAMTSAPAATATAPAAAPTSPYVAASQPATTAPVAAQPSVDPRGLTAAESAEDPDASLPVLAVAMIAAALVAGVVALKVVRR